MQGAEEEGKGGGLSRSTTKVPDTFSHCRSTCCIEEFEVFFIAKAEVADGSGLNAKCGMQPAGDGWGNMCVEPDLHVAVKNKGS